MADTFVREVAASYFTGVSNLLYIVTAFELEGWNLGIEMLFEGLNEEEKRGINEVRNLLVTGNIEGTVPEGGWANDCDENEEESSKADAGGKRGSFIRR